LRTTRLPVGFDLVDDAFFFCQAEILHVPGSKFIGAARLADRPGGSGFALRFKKRWPSHKSGVDADSADSPSAGKNSLPGMWGRA